MVHFWLIEATRRVTCIIPARQWKRTVFTDVETVSESFPQATDELFYYINCQDHYELYNRLLRPSNQIFKYIFQQSF